MKRTKLLSIEGPTAVGKSSLAVFLAKQFGGEVISADSRQVYRGLDIGTEKTTAEAMGGIRHHLIDIADPEDSYTAADFKRDAATSIAHVSEEGHLPIVVGGTGFYIRVLLDDLPLPEVPPNPTLRDELAAIQAETLFAKLEELDPDRAQTIDSKNPRRLIRAIEIATALGRVPVVAPKASPYDAFRIGLTIPDEVLRMRIDTRLEQALERGLVDETKALREEGLSWERLDELGLEYRLCAAYLRGELSVEELREQLKTKLWQYAKRQKTWWKRDPRIRWYDPEDRVRIEDDVRRFLGQP